MNETVDLIDSLLRDLPLMAKRQLATHLKEKNIHLNVYKNPTPVSVAVVPIVNKDGSPSWLGVQRNSMPAKGTFTFPGGYVDSGESAELAASRELQEETSLYLPPDCFAPFATKVTAQNNILIFCKSAITVEEHRVNFEFKNAETQRLVKLTQFSSLGFPTHQEVLKTVTSQ